MGGGITTQSAARAHPAAGRRQPEFESNGRARRDIAKTAFKTGLMEGNGMKIVLGADHRGSSTVKMLAEKLRREGYQAHIVGDTSGKPVDYPEPAFLAGQEIAAGNADRGILICGTGIGVSIAANKVPGVRAAVVHDEMTAQLSRSHNDANMLCLSADLLGERLIEKIVDIWIKTPFEGGRHARRVHKIEAIEQKKDPSTIAE